MSGTRVKFSLLRSFLLLVIRICIVHLDAWRGVAFDGDVVFRHFS